LPDPALTTIAAIFATTQHRKIRSRFELEDAILDEIKQGYEADPHTSKLIEASPGMPNLVLKDGFWFLDDRLVIPNSRNVRETLYRIAHDKLGHFGTPKTYENLRTAFYWPNMRRDLETAYIPSCAECQRNKSCTTKPAGPLHPLPVPDNRCDSVAIDFIGPLPPDEGFDSIVTFTDRSGSDIRIIPTTTKLMAEKLAHLFFKEWYCENGLPLDIVSDRDKLFVSRFWKALHTLTGIKLKMSSAYHPETDGASERTNKTVIPMHTVCRRTRPERLGSRPPKGQIRHHEHDQRVDWFHSLPTAIRKVSAHFTPTDPAGRGRRSRPIRTRHHLTNATNRNGSEGQPHRSEDLTSPTAKPPPKSRFPIQKRRACVVLSTAHRRRTYKSGDQPRVAKFMPRFDGPYKIIETDEKHSTVTLDLPEHSTLFPVFHTSEIKPFKENDDSLFPTRALHPPDPVAIDGHREYFVDKIVDERRRRNARQYLVRWRGEGPEGDLWLAAGELEDCEALDAWQAWKAAERETTGGDRAAATHDTSPPPAKHTLVFSGWGGV
jgi:hypothetical protein